MPNTLSRFARALSGTALAALGRTALACLALSFALTTAAATPAAPVVDASALPEFEPGWATTNPYRGNRDAAEVGRSAYSQSCASCHGPDADGSRAAAPDLRRLGRSCGRVRNDALRQRCMEDVDYYFVKSVLDGKIKLGIEHMPPWEGVLSPKLVWALRSFVETAGGTR